MYCCLAEIKCAEKNLSDHEINRLRETVKLQLDPTDKFMALNSRMLLLTSLETYREVKDKLSYIQENFEKNHGPSIKLLCGFSEEKDDDLLAAIDGARQMLACTTDTNPISGMYYYRFAEI